MKVTIQKDILEMYLSKATSFVSKDASIITSQIQLKATDGILAVSATDYDMGIIATIDNLLIIDDGVAIVSASKLLSSIKALKKGDIQLEVKKDILNITQGKSKFNLPLFQSLDFPKFPNDSDFNNLNISSVSMIDCLKKITQSIDSNNPKYELTGASVKISNDKVEFASTDTKRLSIASLDIKSDDEIKLIIPKRAISEIQKLFFDEVEITYDETLMIVKSSNIKFYAKLINGKFPEYSRIIPKSFNYEISVNKMKMFESIKQVSSFSNEIRITIKSDSISFESITNDNNKAITEIEIETNIVEEKTIQVNSIFMIDFMNSIIENEFTMYVNESEMPFMLESDNLISVIMPIVG